MREARHGIKLVAALIAAALLLPGTALGADGANLNGRFHVSEVVTATDGRGVPEQFGQRSAYIWTFTPSCRYGSCPTVVVSNSGLRIPLGGAASSFNGTSRSTVLCRGLVAPYPVLTNSGYTLVADLSLSATAVAQGAARRLEGTLTLHYNPTAAGSSLNCYPGTMVKRIEATAIAGTVRSAVPPPPKPPAPGPLSAVVRSSIAQALVPIRSAFPINWITLANAIAAVLAMLLITFPAQVFNHTLDENYEEIRDIVRRRLSPLVRIVRAGRRLVSRRPLAAFCAVLAGGALIGGFNDPSFGLNKHSAETYVAVLLTFAVVVATAAVVGAAYRGSRRMKLSPSPHAIPAGLVVAIACVVVSRLTHFEPGYLYGIIAAVAFAGELTHRQRGHEVALASLATLGVATGAWIAWTPVQRAAGGAHPSALLLVADTLLAGLFVSGVVATVINLVPVEPLPGRTLFRWHRGVWGATFLVALFLLVEVMLIPAAHIHHEKATPLVTVISLFVVFAAVSIGFNRFFARRHRVRTEAPPVAN